MSVPRQNRDLSDMIYRDGRTWSERILLTEGGILRAPYRAILAVLRSPFSLIAWLVRAFQRSVDWISEYVENSAPGQKVMAGVRMVIWTDAGDLRRPWRLTSRILIEPFAAVFIAPLRFAWIWIATRPFQPIMWGSPVIILAILSGILMINGRRPGSIELAARYQEEVLNAQLSGDREAEEFWLKHLVAILPEDPRYIFDRAIAAFEEDKLDEARATMLQIAPDDGSGYPLAHFWRVQDAIEQDLPLDDRLAAWMKHHLQVAIDEPTVASEAHALLGQLAVYSNDRPAAILHYAAAKSDQPQVLATLAALYRESGQEIEAVNTSQAAAEYFESLVQQNPADRASRLMWARCLAFARQYQAAIDVLMAGLDEPEPDPEIKPLIAVVSLDWYRQVAKTQPRAFQQQLDLLAQAQRFDPSNAEMLLLLNSLIEQQQEFDQLAENVLREALAAGAPRDLVHLILGTRALKRKNFPLAEFHLSLANEVNPSTPLVMNNLVWAILGQDQPDLDRALGLIDAAAALTDLPQIQGTRAIVLLRQERYRDSISVLEQVLAVHPDPPWVHRQLADAYRKAGDPEMAIIHERRSL